MPSAEFNAIIEALRARPPAIPVDVHGARQAIDEMMGSAPLADGVTVEALTVTARAAEWIRPPAPTSDRVVLYLHGGGFRIGSLRAYRPFASQLAVALESSLLVLDYRLAPEHPFPAGLEDCLAAYAWLLATGWRGDQIAIMGDSAGGGLVVSTLLAAKRRGLPQPAAGVCLSPLADLTCTTKAYARNARTDPYFNIEAAAEAASDYLGDVDARRPLASPIFGDLADLAPMLVHASTHEVLADDAVALASRIAQCGGRVQLDMWPQMTHVWHAMIPHVPESVAAVADVRAFLEGVRSSGRR
ncbi:MAG TPA: alpha/beta hydrolase [Acidimicrobiales bacterium]|nr:alpha/beta hydrolase [Acidimicrobiales bacterium]